MLNKIKTIILFYQNSQSKQLSCFPTVILRLEIFELSYKIQSRLENSSSAYGSITQELKPMISSLDCIVCLQRQCLEAARFVTDDLELQSKILESTMKSLLENGLLTPPPIAGSIVHRIVRTLTGNPDPYYEEIKRFNRLALDHWDAFKKWIAESPNPFETTVRLAIAGNSIDFALEDLSEKRVVEAINQATTQRLSGDLAAFRRAIEAASSILYLTDNAGEIVFDKLLIELLISPEFGKNVSVVTRGAPIINDALYEDAQEIGLTEIVPVMTNGSDGLGVVFDIVSDEFKERLVSADLVIAKGLANLESLWNPHPEYPLRKIAFLFKAKCPFIAEAVDAKLGDLCIQVR